MASNKQEKLKIPLKQSMMMLLGFCKDKLKEQLVSVLPVVIYLILFQSMILGMPIYEAGVISVGTFLFDKLGAGLASALADSLAGRQCDTTPRGIDDRMAHAA